MKWAFFVVAPVIALHAQWLHYPTPGLPRLADGKPNLSAPGPRSPDAESKEDKPDLSGVWTRISPVYHVNIAADLKPEEIQPSARELVVERKENLGADAMTSLCLPMGPAYTTYADGTDAGMMKIIQTPKLILILNPDLTYRQIFLDGRPLEASPNPSFMGYSIGHWDQDTLVVETNGFNATTWLDTSGHPHSEALHTTERYRRRDFGHLDIEVTLSDPPLYARPWTVSVSAELAADTELLEFVCNENNGEREHWVGKASDVTKHDVKVAPEILAKYIGTYLEQPKLWSLRPRVVTITLVDDVLYGEITGKGKERQYARSDTSFSGFAGWSLRFVPDARGQTNELIVTHVSGDYHFARQK